MTALEIKAALEKILAKQYADGEERQERDGSTWGGPGGDVKRAVAYAGDALRDPNPGESASDYLAAMIAGIEAEWERYKSIEQDRDNYGGATFNEILRTAKYIRT